MYSDENDTIYYEEYAGLNKPYTEAENELIGEAMEITEALSKSLDNLDKCIENELELERDEAFLLTLSKGIRILDFLTEYDVREELSDILFELSTGYELDERLWK